jgi:hypothetical protein
MIQNLEVLFKFLKKVNATITNISLDAQDEDEELKLSHLQKRDLALLRIKTEKWLRDEQNYVDYEELQERCSVFLEKCETLLLDPKKAKRYLNEKGQKHPGLLLKLLEKDFFMWYHNKLKSI